MSNQSSSKQQRFAGKVVIVTGASSGIGQQAALEFALEGASLVIHGQNAQRLDETAQQCFALHTPKERVCMVLGSMEDRETAVKIVRTAIEKFARIDVLVNNAGAGWKPGLMAATGAASLELLDYLYEVNLRSVVQLTELCMPHLCKSRGCVVNVSSVASLKPQGKSSHYAAAKAGLDAYTKSMAQLYGPQCVRINSVNPGPVDTYIFKRPLEPVLSAETMETYLKEKYEYFETQTVLDRMGRPSEISSVIKFLASDEASFMTGAIVVVDGGYTVHTTPERCEAQRARCERNEHKTRDDENV